MSRGVAVFVAVLVVVMGSIPLLATPARQADQPAVAGAADESLFVIDRAIIQDEVTGGLRKPTRQETIDLVQTLKKLTRRSFDGLKVTTAADGSQKADLDGGFNQVILARPTAEGGVETLCVSTFEEAAEFLGIRVEPRPITTPEGAR